MRMNENTAVCCLYVCLASKFPWLRKPVAREEKSAPRENKPSTLWHKTHTRAKLCFSTRDLGIGRMVNTRLRENQVWQAGSIEQDTNTLHNTQGTKAKSEAAEGKRYPNCSIMSVKTDRKWERSTAIQEDYRTLNNVSPLATISSVTKDLFFNVVC